MDRDAGAWEGGGTMSGSSTGIQSAVVMGGGLAGIAAAMRLAEAGVKVTLVETRKRLGGRATSHPDPQTGEHLDNCQHVLLGCCTNLIDLYRRHIRGYERVVHLDMHTGYGPRYQMGLVNSPLEPRDSEELARRFAYPLVVKADPSEFYPVQGDMIDYVYTLVREELPEVGLYATSFEFGTLGDSLPAHVRSLRTLILENQMHWSGTRRALGIWGGQRAMPYRVARLRRSYLVTPRP